MKICVCDIPSTHCLLREAIVIVGGKLCLTKSCQSRQRWGEAGSGSVGVVDGGQWVKQTDANNAQALFGPMSPPIQSQEILRRIATPWTRLLKRPIGRIRGHIVILSRPSNSELFNHENSGSWRLFKFSNILGSLLNFVSECVPIGYGLVDSVFTPILSTFNKHCIRSGWHGVCMMYYVGTLDYVIQQ